MEFLSENFFNTSTQMVVDSNTTSVARVLDSDIRQQYQSDGYTSSTVTTFVINFDETKLVNRICLMNCNFGRFGIYTTPGVTTSYMTLDQDSSAWTQTYWGSGINGDDHIFLKTNIDYNVTSLSFHVAYTSPVGNEKAIGYIYIGNVLHTFERNPASKSYKPKKIAKQVVHKLSDGRERINKIKDNWKIDVSYKFVSETERAALLTIYERDSETFFTAFETDASFGGTFFRALWTNTFDFFQYSEDAPNAGYSGKIRLTEAGD